MIGVGARCEHFQESEGDLDRRAGTGRGDNPSASNKRTRLVMSPHTLLGWTK